MKGLLFAQICLLGIIAYLIYSYNSEEIKMSSHDFITISMDKTSVPNNPPVNNPDNPSFGNGKTQKTDPVGPNKPKVPENNNEKPRSEKNETKNNPPNHPIHEEEEDLEIQSGKREFSDFEVKPPTHWRFRTTIFHNQNRTSHLSPQLPFLCKLNKLRFCYSRYPSEVLNTFWIICPIYTANVMQTKHLYELHRNFRSYVQSYGINFQTVEVIFPGQEFQLTRPKNQPYDLQYKEKWIFAMRENLVNVGIKRLPDDWQFVSWIDQHIFWEDAYWFEKAILLMSHYNVVHLLNGNDFLNLQNKTDYHLKGAVKSFHEVGINYWRYVPQQWGLAWATNREIYEKLGGLLDICIGTKCDFYQAVTYTGVSYPRMTDVDEFNDMIGEWQEHAIKVYDGKVGFLDSKVFHFMHCYDGCRTSDYDGQITLLYKHQYSPNKDLKRDAEGRLSLINDALGSDMWKIYGGDERKK